MCVLTVAVALFSSDNRLESEHKLCTSGFVDDVMFGRVYQVAHRRRSCCLYDCLVHAVTVNFDLLI